MKITILGSGTILSGPERRPSAFLLEKDENMALLDMGPGILYQLTILGVDLLKPNTIFLTHFHLDHCSDVFPYLMSRYLLETQSNKEIKIYGPQGLNTWYDTHASLQGNWLSENPPEVIEIYKNPFNWAGYQIRTFLTGHTDQCIAYRFDHDKSYFFSGDTGFNQELIVFAKDADLGFLECSHPDECPVSGHLTPKEAGKFAQLANIKHLAINHMYPENDTVNLKKYIAHHYNGLITILEDTMVLNKNT